MLEMPSKGVVNSKLINQSIIDRLFIYVVVVFSSPEPKAHKVSL